MEDATCHGSCWLRAYQSYMSCTYHVLGRHYFFVYEIISIIGETLYTEYQGSRMRSSSVKSGSYTDTYPGNGK